MPRATVERIPTLPHRAGLRRIAARMRAARCVLITTHLQPDPDGLGSALALASALGRLGIPAEVVVGSPLPLRYASMDEASIVRVLGPDDPLPNADVAVILDTSTGWERTGRPGALLAERYAAKECAVLCVDHHPHGQQPADLKVVDPHATATAVLVYHLVLQLTHDLTPQEAGWLYLGIVTDTASFRWPSTNAEAHRIVADLMERGADARALYTAMYEHVSMNRLHLLGESLQSIRLEASGHLAVMTVSRAQFAHYGLAVEDAPGFADHAVTVEGAEVGAALLEYPDDRTRVILRAKGNVPVGEIAEALGGGGHAFAAAAVVAGGIEDAMKMLIDVCFPFLASEVPTVIFPAAD